MIGHIIIALGYFRYKSEEDIKRDVKFLEKILFCHDVRYYSHEFILMSEILNFEDIEV
jgi:hypothetical protein